MTNTAPEIEIVVEDVPGAQIAAEEGADSIELCTNLDEGGLTPGSSLIRATMAAVKGENLKNRDKPNTLVHCLILNKVDGFYPDTFDIAEMIISINRAKACGANGVVFGALTPNDEVNVDALRPMLEAAKGMTTTFHRAFDRIKDKATAIETLISLGFNRILTSGNPGKAPDHAETISKLVKKAAGRITIVAGGGIRAANLLDLAKTTNVPVLHMSCRSDQKSASGIHSTDPEKVRKVIQLRRGLG